MKVMWMGNIILPAIAEKESLPPVYIVGWLVGLSRRLTQLPDVAPSSCISRGAVTC